jgi:hypothetical protein
MDHQMEETANQAEWKKNLAGGFCFQTAPFAVHPLDGDRAEEAVRLARGAGIKKDDFVAEARKYLETAVGWPTDVEKQLERVRNFIEKKL